MGGWCRIREICPHYNAGGVEEPEERLCVPDHDGVGRDFPIRITRMAGSVGWLRAKHAQTWAGAFVGTDSRP